MLESLTSHDFNPLLEQTFRLHHQPGQPPLEVTLVEVVEFGPEPPAGGRQPFSLVFRGPLSPVLPQRIYPLEHPMLGALEIFIVPLGPEQGGVRYQVIFS